MSSLYANRRRSNKLAITFSYAATGFGLGWLVLILGVLLYEGVSGLSLRVFIEMTPPPGADGGLLNPIIGSLMLTVLAVTIGTPSTSGRSRTSIASVAIRRYRVRRLPSSRHSATSPSFTNPTSARPPSVHVTAVPIGLGQHVREHAVQRDVSLTLWPPRGVARRVER